MNKKKEALVLACQQLMEKMEDKFSKQNDDDKAVLLSDDQVLDLGERILALPDDDITILLLHYYFNMDFRDIEDLLGQKVVKGKLKFAEKLLSNGMGLLDGECFHLDSIVASCSIAMRKYTAVNIEREYAPNYSKAFYRRMIKIKAMRRHKSPYVSILQKVAIFFLVLGMSFGIALGVNAELRERMFRWLVETFPQFTNFMLTTAETSFEGSYDALKNYMPSYVPENYHLNNISELFPSIYYDYINDEGNMYTIIGRVPDSGSISLNTEGAQVETVLFRDGEAYYWVKGNETYFVFFTDGYEFSIFGHLSKDTIVAIAESIEMSS